MNDYTNEVKALLRQFRVASAASAPLKRVQKNWEEMYFGDVEGTWTQFTQKQLEEIQNKYDIPISTKLNWAIIEQMLSFLTGSKPYARLISPTNNPEHRLMAQTYEVALNAAWYESRFNEGLRDVIRDMLSAGIGWSRVRRNNFFTESTFDTIIEYLNYRQVFVDPHARKPDFSDAEYMIIADVMPISKAERIYDIKIKPGTDGYFDAQSADHVGDFGDVWQTMGNILDMEDLSQDKNRYVFIREFFNRVEVQVYVSEEGHVGNIRPTPIEVPNEAKLELGAEIQALAQEIEAMNEQATNAASSQQAIEEQGMQGSISPETMAAQGGVAQAKGQHSEEALIQMQEQLKEMEQVYAGLPDMVNMLKMKTLSGQEAIVKSVRRLPRKHIKRVLMVGTQILEREILPFDEYPIVPFIFSHARSPRRIYSVTHYIGDLIKAMNKFWALTIYDMMVNSNRKVLYPEGSITEISQVENKWSQPDSWIGYVSDPALPDGGRPHVIDPSALNRAVVELIDRAMQLVEYITGISALQQGQTSSATPDTFGGIQTMQAFGTQRIKHQSRNIESGLERLSYIIACHLQAYAPKNSVTMFLDENGDEQEVALFETNENFRFKVRTTMAANLPTSRHMAAQLLGIVAGQTGNQQLADLMTTEMLRLLDTPNADKLADQVDVVKQMGSQIAELEQMNKDLESTNRQLQQQMAQKEIQAEKEAAKNEIQTAMELEKAQMKAEGRSEPDFTAIDSVSVGEYEPPF